MDTTDGCVSSKEQYLDRQSNALKGVDRLFTDKISEANTNRPELQKFLTYICEGDIALATELDRLDRNNQDLTKIMTNFIIELYKYQAEANASGSLNVSNKGFP